MVRIERASLLSQAISQAQPRAAPRHHTRHDAHQAARAARQSHAGESRGRSRLRRSGLRGWLPCCPLTRLVRYMRRGPSVARGLVPRCPGVPSVQQGVLLNPPSVLRVQAQVSSPLVALQEMRMPGGIHEAPRDFGHGVQGSVLQDAELGLVLVIASGAIVRRPHRDLDLRERAQRRTEVLKDAPTSRGQVHVKVQEDLHQGLRRVLEPGHHLLEDIDLVVRRHHAGLRVAAQHLQHQAVRNDRQLESHVPPEPLPQRRYDPKNGLQHADVPHAVHRVLEDHHAEEPSHEIPEDVGLAEMLPSPLEEIPQHLKAQQLSCKVPRDDLSRAGSPQGRDARLAQDAEHDEEVDVRRLPEDPGCHLVQLRPVRLHSAHVRTFMLSPQHDVHDGVEHARELHVVENRIQKLRHDLADDHFVRDLPRGRARGPFLPLFGRCCRQVVESIHVTASLHLECQTAQKCPQRPEGLLWIGFPASAALSVRPERSASNPSMHPACMEHRDRVQRLIYTLEDPAIDLTIRSSHCDVQDVHARLQMVFQHQLNSVTDGVNRHVEHRPADGGQLAKAGVIEVRVREELANRLERLQGNGAMAHVNSREDGVQSSPLAHVLNGPEHVHHPGVQLLSRVKVRVWIWDVRLPFVFVSHVQRDRVLRLHALRDGTEHREARAWQRS
mmetsp:Transcript_2961/g.11994  ORF Transcript_2961/g.11994 Transcript_2961/m.11994 type:complete len:668 (+) Transcript_2961:2575-4578(+)|eukprot:scaffold3350_cov268-Pinguiococcus_pyrenoidosus.AAC.38